MQVLTRQVLYDLIWSEPARLLAPRLGISDAGLSKLCEGHQIPQPPRGYWAKQSAGKKVAKLPLPARGFGIREVVTPRSSYSWTHYQEPKDLIDADIPAAPTFDVSRDELASLAEQVVRKVSVPKDFSRAHRAIQGLLQADVRRRELYRSERYPMLSHRPLFDSPFERRRLRVLNALMLALTRIGVKPSLSRKNDPNCIDVTVGHQSFSITVDEPDHERRGWRTSEEATKLATDKLRVHFSLRLDEIAVAWEDDANSRVEDHITEVVVHVLVAGELSYRRSELSHHAWLIERKAELIEERRRQAEERERKERERLAAEQQALIDGLLRDADNHRRANDIRDYVAAVCARAGARVGVELETWSKWALDQADKLDPIASGSVLWVRSQEGASVGF